jgi:hypothetical protein
VQASTPSTNMSGSGGRCSGSDREASSASRAPARLDRLAVHVLRRGTAPQKLAKYATPAAAESRTTAGADFADVVLAVSNYVRKYLPSPSPPPRATAAF